MPPLTPARFHCRAGVFISALFLALAGQPALAALAALASGFANPPADCRIMMRWWWFGPAVSETEIARELRVMKAAGIGGVEIQPVYPLALDDARTGFHNQPYLSPEFLKSLRFAAVTARSLGLRVDITLGSGWPYGGPHTSITEAAGRLRIEQIPVSEGSRSVAVPALENGESLIAAFAGNERIRDIHDGRAFPPSGTKTVQFFVSSRTGQQVKRASIGAEGFVLDHYDKAAIEHHLSAVGDRLLSAFGGQPPYAVFSDSLEVYGSDWTDDLPAEFARRRGYDLIPHLPELVSDVERDSAKVRHDWGETLTELAEERYLTPIADWAHRHHTRFRSQTYGTPPMILSSAVRVDLPEGEAGPQWRTFNTARWASSANHLYGRNVTSTETWTWLHAPSFRATPLDMKAEADLHFIEGINQLIGHGWPYSPPEAGEPGWRFYASAAFNDHNPWFQVMPEITRYLQRVSFLMRQGAPANDIAIYLPTDDAWAGFRPGKTSVNEAMPGLLGPTLIPQILDAGYNFDYIDDRAIAKVGVPYRLLIIPATGRMPAETLARVKAYQNKGGLVIDMRHAQVTESLLHQMLAPDLSVSPEAAPVIGFVHRKLPSADIYFIVNTSNDSIETPVKARITGLSAEWWDPFTGERSPASDLNLKLAPYESRVLVFSKEIAPARNQKSAGPERTLDLSADWSVTFEGLHKTVQMARLESWTEDEDTRFYSGRAAYEKTIEIPKGFGKAVLDFGPGENVDPPTGNAPGMRALLESPVRECALVYVNGQLAGSVWRPPYEVDISRRLQPGTNRLRIEVANLAINEMAGRALPDYRLLNLRYGKRFEPQGFENLHPLPAGIVGPVTLILR